MTTPPPGTEQWLWVVEPFGTFGPTFQGEGPSTGQQALFIRLSRCNLACPGCDTPESWDWSRYDPRTASRRVAVDDLARWALDDESTELVVLTGGEPLLQQPSVAALARALAVAGRRVEIETNGTQAPRPELVAAVTRFIVSPKLAAFGAGMSRERRIVPGALHLFVATGKAVFKFVVSSVADLTEIATLEREFGLAPVWVMPTGITRDEVLDGLGVLADPVLVRGWNLGGRLHIVLWGNDRGR